MKNKFAYSALLAAVLSFSSSDSSAFPYWRNLYSNRSHANSGCETPTGHLIGGYNVFPQNINMVDLGPMVIHTNTPGYFPSAAEFNRTYEFTIGAAKYPINVNVNRAIPMKSGYGYVAVASFSYDNVALAKTKHGLLYMVLDNNGNVFSYKAYEFTSNTNALRLTALRQANNDPAGNENFLICGQVTRVAEDVDMFVIRFDDALNMVFSNVYDFFGLTAEHNELPNDIIESPYGNNEILVVGQGEFNTSGSRHDGFILGLNSNTGAVTVAENFDLGGFEAFTGITDNFADVTDPGFAICGYQKDLTTGASIPWLMKWDHTTNTQYLSMLYNNVSRPNTEAKPMRINHVFNPDPLINEWTYTIGGNIVDLNTGASQSSLTIVDKNGTVVQSTYDPYFFGQQITYAGHGDAPLPHLYGNYAIPDELYPDWVYIANFGLCSVYPDELVANRLDPISQPFLQWQYTMFTLLKTNYVGLYDNSYREYCRAEETTGEKSTSISSQKLANNVVKLYPNPASSELNVDRGAMNNANYVITNTLGMVVAKGIFTSSHEVVNIGSYPAGVYVLSIVQDGQTKNYKFVKE